MHPTDHSATDRAKRIASWSRAVSQVNLATARQSPNTMASKLFIRTSRSFWPSLRKSIWVIWFSIIVYAVVLVLVACCYGSQLSGRGFIQAEPAAISCCSLRHFLCQETPATPISRRRPEFLTTAKSEGTTRDRFGLVQARNHQAQLTFETWIQESNPRLDPRHGEPGFNKRCPGIDWAWVKGVSRSMDTALSVHGTAAVCYVCGRARIMASVS
jgi:hypothetical protein